MQRGNTVTGNPRPPQYLSRHAKVTATTLAQEAQETITAVRKMLQVDSKLINNIIMLSMCTIIVMYTTALPFGWEEAYTEDGQKYFIK